MTNRTNTVDIDLPDDPRQVCRLILEALQPLDGMPHETMPGDFARVCHTVIVGNQQTGGELDPILPALANLAVQAEEAADLYREAMHRIWELARHGTGDQRESDKRLAARAQALDEGREPPYEPTYGEVQGAVIASAAAGKPLSDDEAVALLKARHAA